MTRDMDRLYIARGPHTYEGLDTPPGTRVETRTLPMFAAALAILAVLVVLVVIAFLVLCAVPACAGPAYGGSLGSGIPPIPFSPLSAIVFESGQAILDMGSVSPLAPPAIYPRAIHLDIFTPGPGWSLFIHGSGDLTAGGGSKRIPLSRLKFASTVGSASYGSPWWRPLSTTQTFVAGRLSTGSPYRSEVWIDLKLDVTWDDAATAPGERYKTDVVCTLTQGELTNNYVFPNPFCPSWDGFVRIYHYHTGSPSYPRTLTCSIKNASGQLVFSTSSTVPRDGSWVGFSWHGRDTSSRTVPDGVYAFAVTDNQEPDQILTAGTITLVNNIPGTGSSSVGGQVVSSATGAGLANAEVRLFTGNRREVALRLSGDDGSFRFDSLPAGDYYLEVWRPGYLPSTSPAVRVPAGEHRSLRVSLTPNTAIYLTAEAIPQQAAPGDIVTFNISVENVGTRLLRDVIVEDASAYPFAPPEDKRPSQGAGPRIRSLGSIEIGQKKTVAFRVIVLPDAPPGSYAGRIRASALALGPGDDAERVEAGPVSPRVQILPGIFGDAGMIVGRAYADLDGDSVRDDDEPPARQSIVVLEDGSKAKTDDLGRFLLPGLRPGPHAVKLIQPSMGDAIPMDDAILVDVPRGGATTVDLPAKPRPGDREERPGHARVEVDVLASAEVRGGLCRPSGPSTPAGSPITGHASGSITLKGDGVAEYEIGAAFDSDGLPARAGSVSTMEDVVDRVASAFTSTYYAAAGPTGHATAGPSGYTTAVGPSGHAAAGSSGYTAAEAIGPTPRRLSLSGRARVPLGPGKLTLSIGDVGVGAGPPNSPGGLSGLALASVSGLGLQYSLKTASLGIFLGKPGTARFTEKIAGRNTSGPYFLQHCPVVEGSIDISVETYHKSTGSVIRVTRPRYAVDYSTGRITFDRTIERNDQNGNPVMIAISYEAAVPPGGTASLAAGGHLSIQHLSPKDATGLATGFTLDLGAAVPGRVHAGLSLTPNPHISVTGTYSRGMGEVAPGRKGEEWTAGISVRPAREVETWLKGIDLGEREPSYEVGASLRLQEGRLLTLRKTMDSASIACSTASLQFSLNHVQGGSHGRHTPGVSATSAASTTYASLSTTLLARKTLRLTPSIDIGWQSGQPGPGTLGTAIGVGFETLKEGPMRARGVYQKSLSQNGHSSLDLDLEALAGKDISTAAKLSFGGATEGYRRDIRLALDWRPAAGKDLVALAYLRSLDLAGVSPYSLLEGSCLVAGRISPRLSISYRLSKKAVAGGWTPESEQLPAAEQTPSNAKSPAGQPPNAAIPTAHTDMYAVRAVIEITPRIHLMADYMITQQHESGSLNRRSALEAIGAITDNLRLGVGWASDAGPYLRLVMIAGWHWYGYHAEACPQH